MKNFKICLCTLFLCTGLIGFAASASALDETEPISYDKVAPSYERTTVSDVGRYGMVPIYGFDVKDGTYPVEVDSSSSMFHIVDAVLTVENGNMQAVLTLSGTGYLKLFMGTAQEAAASDESAYIGYTENEEGLYTYTIPVEALDKAISCAAFSRRKGQWYDRNILFDASTLPEDALEIELPDYKTIEKAMRLWRKNEAEKKKAEENGSETEETKNLTEEAAAETAETNMPAAEAVEPMSLTMEDGEYAIEATLYGGSGKAAITSPTILTVQDGKAYARIEWSSSNYDYMIVGTEKYLNENDIEEGRSTFTIPVAKMDAEMPVIADTTAMGTPHEIEYVLTFYSDSIGPKSQLPQEAAKRVVALAFVIIIGGGILNHFVNKKRRC